MSILEIENKIKKAWEGTPAVIKVKEIKHRSEIPRWEDCLRNHLYMGIIRRNNGDRIIVVKHSFEGIFELNCPVEKLGAHTLDKLGIFPDYKNMVCSQCGQFSTRIDIGGICVDCKEENRHKASK